MESKTLPNIQKVQGEFGQISLKIKINYSPKRTETNEEQ